MVTDSADGAAPIRPPFEVMGEINITRVFDASRELVFRAWVEREHLERWWGPHGFTTTNIEMDVIPGGAWHYVMRGPDGNDYPFVGMYVEVVEPELIVFEGAINGSSGFRIWVEVVFSDLGPKSEVKVRQLYSFRAASTKNTLDGWNQQFDRLAEFLGG